MITAALAIVIAAPATASASPTAGPAGGGTPYPCTASGGPNADASALGWLGNGQGATACLGGSFYVPNGIDTAYGFGVYNDSPTTWANAGGYLPALVTSFTADGARVSITNFGDRVVIGGHPYVTIYSRVAVHNPGNRPVTVEPAPPSTMTTWWPKTGSAAATRGPRPGNSPRPEAGRSTSRTCGRSGTGSWRRSRS
jgi:hypothetical protein